jgi:hypothetical protein
MACKSVAMESNNLRHLLLTLTDVHQSGKVGESPIVPKPPRQPRGNGFESYAELVIPTFTLHGVECSS